MATQITNYKCPSCTGPLRFGETSGKLECDYCGSSFEVEEIEKLYAEETQESANVTVSQEQQEYTESVWGENMRAYICPSCGAEIVCDNTTSATSCPYCGNTSIVPSNFDGNMKPDYIIPFKLDKDAAVAALKNHYKGKRLLPRAFTDANHIKEIKGVYVPFWLFDAEADADITFRAERTGSHREGKFLVTTTEHYNVRRAGKVNFSMIPVDASNKMPDGHMDSIEPFNYDELKPFSMAYLAGFLADRYDVTNTECAKRAKARGEKSVEDAFRSTVVGYSEVSTGTKDIKLKIGEIKYALLPVWMLSTTWNDTNYLFAMNGQTGRLVGDLPTDKLMFWKWFGMIALPLAVLLALILFL